MPDDVPLPDINSPLPSDNPPAPPSKTSFLHRFTKIKLQTRLHIFVTLFSLLSIILTATAFASQNLSILSQAAGFPRSISLRVGDKGSVQCPGGELAISWTTANSKKSVTVACVKPTSTPSSSGSPSPMPSGMVMTSPTPVPNGTAAGGGFGVGNGDGLAVGINLAKFNQVKADAAKGIYDRPCTAAEHDDTKWHGLVNVEAKCHYDHEHGDDPNYVNDIFGEPGVWFNKPGQSISYPWQTFALPSTTTEQEALASSGTEGQKENNLKHEGYYWIVRRNQTCDGGTYCITDFRTEVHFMSSHHNEVGSRWHSFAFEGRLCKDPKDASTCGIYRTGGWVDHRQLVITNSPSDDCWTTINGLKEGKTVNGKIIAVPNDSQFRNINSEGLTDEFRCHKNVTEAMVKAMPNGSTNNTVAEWWAAGASDFRYVVKVFDPISNVDPTNPTGVTAANVPFCKQGDPTCRWNNSLITASQGYTTQIYADADTNGDGKTDFTQGKRYMNRFGGSNSSCTTAGLDCIPLILDKVPLAPNGGNQRYSNKQCDSCSLVDHDLTPVGVPSWIQWFYRK